MTAATLAVRDKSAVMVDACHLELLWKTAKNLEIEVECTGWCGGGCNGKHAKRPFFTMSAGLERMLSELHPPVPTAEVLAVLGRWTGHIPCHDDHRTGDRFCDRDGHRIQRRWGQPEWFDALRRELAELEAKGLLPGGDPLAPPPGRYRLVCQICGNSYTSKRAYSRTCSDNCRQKLSKRNRKARQASQTAGVFT